MTTLSMTNTTEKAEPMLQSNLPVNIRDVHQAMKNLHDCFSRTPLISSHYLSTNFNSDINLKLENIQRTGSFKVRGAYNKLTQLTEDERRRGVVTQSAGNHAQGVALSCDKLGISAKIVMPENAPKAKIEATKGYGAEVILHGKNFDECRAMVDKIIAEENRIFVHPFDDKYVIAGQGTVGLEIIEDLWDVETIVCPIGGGGLIAGIAVAAKSFNPDIDIIGVQADNVHGMKASLDAGKVVTHRDTGTIADGCDVATPGVLTFEICKKLVTDVVLVSEDEIRLAMKDLVQRNKFITEGAGALSSAALISGKLDPYIKNKKTVLVLSGGNVDLSKISDVMTQFM